MLYEDEVGAVALAVLARSGNLIRRSSVDEPTAWLNQASADRDAAERFVADEGGIGRCHAIAKWQQAVEKNVKALVSVLHDAGHMKAGIVQKHDVSRYMSGHDSVRACAR